MPSREFTRRKYRFSSRILTYMARSRWNRSDNSVSRNFVWFASHRTELKCGGCGLVALFSQLTQARSHNRSHIRSRRHPSRASY